MSIWMHMLLVAVLLYMIYGAYVAKTFYEGGKQGWFEVFFCASCVLMWFPYWFMGWLMYDED